MTPRLALLPATGVLVLVAALVSDLTRPGGTLALALVPDPAWGSGLTGLVHLGLAAVVLREGTRRRMGQLLALTGAAWSLGAVVRIAVHSSAVASGMADGAQGAEVALLWLADLTASPLSMCTTVLMLVFPDGRFLAGVWGVVGRVSLAVTLAVGVLLLVVGPAPIAASPDPTSYPAAVARQDPTSLLTFGGSSDFLVAAITIAYVSFFTGPLTSVLVRFRRATGVERDRMRWVLWGVLVVALVVVLTRFLGLADSDTLFILLMINTIGLSMGIGLIHPRLVSIEDLLSRTVVFGGVSLFLVAVDLAVITVLTGVLDEALSERDVLLVVLVLSAVVYAPLRVRFAALVRRVVRGDREHPYGAVAGLAASLEVADDEDAQLAAVARAVASSFGVSFVRVEVDRPDGERITAVRGTPPAETRILPIRYREETVGRLVLPARGLRTRLSRRDERLLGDLVRQAATFARTRRLADELQRNRERLVVAREEERRRIRRDLHDQLAPTLGGVVFQVDTATMLLERDPDAAQARIAETTDDLREVVTRVRRLVHDLRPPALDDVGLVEALRQHALALPLPVGVATDLPVVDELPAAVEVAVYRIAVDALDNVVRHARATSASVLLLGPEPGHRQVVLEVRDDGVGIPPEVEAGQGLVTLRERAGELGGRVEVVCPPEGGTVLRATIPVRAA